MNEGPSQADVRRERATRMLAPSSGPEFLDALEASFRTGRLYILSHDGRSLLPLLGDLDRVDDLEVIDALLGEETVALGDTRLVPFACRSYPLVVGVFDPDQVVADPPDALVATMAVDVQRSLLDIIERRRRDHPFEPVAELQWALLPIRSVEFEGFDVAGTLLPAATVAGDAYDIGVSPSGALCVYVFDAMGRGVTPTLSTSLSIATIRASRRRGASLLDQVRRADEALAEEFGGRRFVTLAAIELTKTSLHAVNAGHEPIRRLETDGAVHTLALRADPPLGVESQLDYHLHELAPLDAGEALVMLSDGAAESRNADGEMLGRLGVHAALEANPGSTSLQLATRFGRAVQRYVGGELKDDLTSVVVRRQP